MLCYVQSLLSEGIFHAVLFTQLPIQSVSISHAVIHPATLSGSLYLMLLSTDTETGSMSRYIVQVVQWR
jgi:hypothetical protein